MRISKFDLLSSNKALEVKQNSSPKQKADIVDFSDLLMVNVKKTDDSPNSPAKAQLQSDGMIDISYGDDHGQLPPDSALEYLKNNPLTNSTGASTGAVVPATPKIVENTGVLFGKLRDTTAEARRRARNPADNVQPNDPMMEAATDNILNSIAEKHGSGEGTPTQRLSSMGTEELDRAIQEEFIKRATYQPDVDGDQWDPVDRGIVYLENGDANFIGDCEDLSFKLASMMQNAHARRYQQNEGMSWEQAKAQAAEEVNLLGTNDHMLVGVQNKDGYTTLYDPNGMPPAIKVKLPEHAEELGISFRAKAGEVELFDKDFDMASYEPGTWSQISEEERQAMYDSIGKSLSQCSALTPNATGHWAIPDMLLNPFGIFTKAWELTQRAYSVISHDMENRAEPVPVDIDAEVARQNYESFEFSPETQEADNPTNSDGIQNNNDIDAEAARQNSAHFEHSPETQEADNPTNSGGIQNNNDIDAEAARQNSAHFEHSPETQEVDNPTNSGGGDGGGSDSGNAGGDAGDGADF